MSARATLKTKGEIIFTFYFLFFIFLFVGLRDKLTEKYLQNGRIIPPAPDKSVLGMTKVKMSKEDDVSDQSGKSKLHKYRDVVF